MQRSTDRILTTHTGSLPRPDDLVSLLERHDQREARSEPPALPGASQQRCQGDRTEAGGGRRHRGQRRRDEQGRLLDLYPTGPGDRLLEPQSRPMPRQVEAGQFPEYYQAHGTAR